MSELVLAAVAKRYGNNPVLRGVDLNVPSGSLTAILGSSGSGKTTLLRVVAGFERADHGTIHLGGADITKVPAARRHIGYVPQEGVLFPHLTVLGNVTFGLPHKDRRASAVRELVEMVGLDGLETRFPHQLSGGQQQRVALARALAVNPSLVLLDEPFAALDASLRATVRADVVRIITAAGATAVLVTHDQDEALSMADQVAVLRDGVIVQHGSPEELYQSPVDASLAAFLGEANLVTGSVHGSVASTALGTLTVPKGTPAGAAVVLVRPEQIQLADTLFGVPGKVVRCEYYGHDAMLEVAWAGGIPLRVRITAARVPPVGSEVCVSVSGQATAWTMA